MKGVGNLVDDLIAVFSPRAAAQRKAWRSIYGQGGYDAADYSRSDTPVPPSGRIAENDNSVARKMLRDRARDLEKNSDSVEAMITVIADNVIGTNLNMQAQTKDSDFNAKIEALFADWCHAENCDIAETQSFREIIEMCVRRYLVDGGILAITSIERKSKYGLKIQLREVDDLDESTNSVTEKGNQIVHGVELNKYGKPVAYYLKTYRAGTQEEYDVERISANRVLFLWKKTRVTQYREVTRLAPSITRINDLEDFNKALSFQQKAAACTQAFIESDGTSAPGRPQNTQDGKRIHDLQAGTIVYLKPGEHLKPFVPQGQGNQADLYTVMQQRMIAAAQGLSLESATRNVERVNYSSARQNLLADQKTYKRFREFLAEHFLRPLYIKFIETCYLKGLLSGTKFNSESIDYYKCRWLTEGVPWIDPKKEAEADAIRLANGGLSFQRYCADNGTDWRERIDEMAEVQEYAKSKGVELNYIAETENLSKEENTDESSKTTGGDIGK